MFSSLFIAGEFSSSPQPVQITSVFFSGESQRNKERNVQFDHKSSYDRYQRFSDGTQIGEMAHMFVVSHEHVKDHGIALGCEKVFGFKFKKKHTNTTIARICANQNQL